jgi:hypothetical protein
MAFESKNMEEMMSFVANVDANTVETNKAVIVATPE